MTRIHTTCDWCGKEIYIYPWELKTKKHHYCCRDCVNASRSKTKNPEGYKDVVDYSNQSKHMTELNMELNSVRMTAETREKLSMARRVSSEELGRDTYAKVHGRHVHRVVAEQILGRPLNPGEVVHHLNGDRHDNRPENLMICQDQSEHMLWHALLDEEKGGDE